MSMTPWHAALFLENGHLFEGLGYGAKVGRGGEAVFNTGMTGYQEIYTDPSYAHQIVVMGSSHIGNTGINSQDVESMKLYLSGVVAREYTEVPSNWRSEQTLSDYLANSGVPLISDVDTREITQILRDEGAQRGIIFPASEAKGEKLIAFAKTLLEKVPSMEGLELVSQVSCEKPYQFESQTASNEGTIVVYDFGVKLNILRSLKLRNFNVQVVPSQFSAKEVLAYQPKAVLLSNGPGDPSQVKGVVDEIRQLIGRVPIMAICMGHQLLARAIGADTYKLKFGHHGINHPVKDCRTGKILITSQNHGFAVRSEDLSRLGVKVTHVSENDQTVEGFCSEKDGYFSVQFHPESKPGPNDASSLFDQFIRGYLR